MATFIFLHGSFHAFWNWHKVILLVQAHGHRGVALDLPGHGHDDTPLRKVSLAGSVAAVLAVIDATKDEVVLVAHSRNGIAISEAAEQRSERLFGLVSRALASALGASRVGALAVGVHAALKVYIECTEDRAVTRSLQSKE